MLINILDLSQIVELIKETPKDSGWLSTVIEFIIEVLGMLLEALFS